MEKTITSANSIFTLTVPGLFPAPVQLMGYSTDRAFTTDAVQMSEAQMGVDGRLSAGYTPSPIVQTITLQADSPSRDIFSTLITAMDTAREVYWINGTISLPATGESYTMTRGVLVNAKSIPDAQRVLAPVDYMITWESVARSLL